MAKTLYGYIELVQGERRTMLPYSTFRIHGVGWLGEAQTSKHEFKLTPDTTVSLHLAHRPSMLRVYERELHVSRMTEEGHDVLQLKEGPRFLVTPASEFTGTLWCFLAPNIPGLAEMII